MLTPEENELLTRVGPGTPMGDLLRQYWMPAMLSAELTPDGPPLRIRLLGEDLIAFRDTDGRVGLVANNCAHRGASLFFGRNEDRGLRCVYHGWKYDVAGRCVDMPNEPPQSNFREKIHLIAYPCQERGGVVWTYMGPLSEPPPLPDLEWSLVPANQRLVTYRWQACNWVQTLEGGIDSSHISFLHRRIADLRGQSDDRTVLFRSRDTHPRFEVLDTEYGAVIAARREAEADQYYWRISQFLMPFHQMIPPTGGEGRGGHAWVPVDDENTITWTMSVHPPLTDEEQEARLHNGNATYPSVDQFLPPVSGPYGAWRSALNATNDYGLDRRRQANDLFFGVRGIWAQDQAVQESQGAIYDRAEEHVGTADLAIIRVRQMLMDAARALREQGVAPASALNAAAYRVRSASLVLRRSAAWLEASREHLVAQVP
jgi:phthalate 4,5-dioxygenase oxygenase subunit